MDLWRNWLTRHAHNVKIGGSSPSWSTLSYGIPMEIRKKNRCFSSIKKLPLGPLNRVSENLHSQWYSFMTPTGGSTLRLCEASADKRVLFYKKNNLWEL